jgi:hypothetical protein
LGVAVNKKLHVTAYLCTKDGLQQATKCTEMGHIQTSETIHINIRNLLSYLTLSGILYWLKNNPIGQVRSYNAIQAFTRNGTLYQVFKD